jgi:sodium/pantothenate symporter
MGIELSGDSLQVLVAFGLYLVGVATLGVFAHRYLSRGSFVKEYFLGNRGLGPWVLALTVAATAISGGTFMGFPSLIYTNGWIMALWIASYMVVPLTTMALLGKRINQVARIAGSVTVPDVLRDRFGSPTLGICSTLIILVLLVFNLVAQFKGGANVMKEALRLPPERAEFLKAKVDPPTKLLVLYFQRPNGEPAERATPLPDESARYLRDKTVVNPEPAEQAHVLVHFQVQQETVEKKVTFPPQEIRLPISGMTIEKGYLIGLIIFAMTVVAYTTYGGFWAVTWTDVLEGMVMLIGVVVMAVLAVRAVEPIVVERAPPSQAGSTGPAAVVKEELHGLAAATETLRQNDARLVYGPGPASYLPLGLAFSFFLMWSLMGAGNPSGMVRLMSFKDSASLRRALLLICFYYLLTYLCLLIIFVCARAIYPTEYLREAGSEALGEPDSIMPAMTRRIAHPLVAGLLLAAPYAALMSTVAAFLLMISSSLVRDIYQRTINPKVSDRTIKISSYVITGLVGVLVMIGALNPPGFLQYIIVFTGSGLGCAFLVPMALTLFWRRATKAGILAGVLGGFFTVVALYVLGWTDSRSRQHIEAYERAPRVANQPTPAAPEIAHWLQDNLNWIPGWGERRHDPFLPLFVGGMDTLVWGLLASLILGIGVSLATRPDPALVAKYFPDESQQSAPRG